MMVIGLVACYLALITLSFAPGECTPENLNCSAKYKIGSVDVALEKKQLRELIEQKEKLGRMYKNSDLQKYVVSIKHEWQEIPEFFDAREKWPMCESISRIKDQNSCGTCWAFAGGTVASDRSCIASEGRIKVDVSEQHTITCSEVCISNPFRYRCSAGSSVLSALAYTIENEVVDEECKPYDDLTVERECELSCKNETMPYNTVNLNMSVILYGLVNFGSTLEDIQIEIMEHGPVSALLLNYETIFPTTYTDEVLTVVDSSNSDEETDTHAIRVLGWGVEDGIPYWLCANSWGKSWGNLGGFFKVKRGTNESGMETHFLAVGPKSRLIEGDKKDHEIWLPEYDDSSSFTKTSHIFEITIVLIVSIFVYIDVAL